MKKEILSENLPIRMWLDNMEEGALAQAKNLANLPFAFRHIAIMPDSHLGYGMPIGGVLATREVIIPNAVGVDIGCGMCAVQTNLEQIDQKTLEHIIEKLRQAIPVGFNSHKQAQPESMLPEPKSEKLMPVVCRQYSKARHQVGTLGSGNHFIEIQKGNDNHIWIMIHSGSRNLGKQVAEHYNALAAKLNASHPVKVPKTWQLAFLPLEKTEAKSYVAEMEYCVEFALANRRHMMSRVQSVLDPFFPDIIYKPMINIAHNYAALEYHFGQNVVVHRKGATQAKKGQLGIIPGSQGTKSYIVQGKGNPESFESCSHGAGRIMGRKQAMRELKLEKEKAALDRLGIIHSVFKTKHLDEAPGAYKNISEVMKNQQDLVDIIVELAPLAVIKG